MPTVYIVHGKNDKAFLYDHLLPVLPAQGFDHWISARFLPKERLLQAMNACDALVILYSESLTLSVSALNEVHVALESRNMPLVLQLHAGPATPGHAFEDIPTARLAALPKIAVRLGQEQEALEQLTDLLPFLPDGRESQTPEGAQSIAWSEAAFSTALMRATAQRDFLRAEALVKTLEAHISVLDDYTGEYAFNDLKQLRQQRMFGLMERYAEMVLARRVSDPGVRRQYAQALIENGRYDAALEVLEALCDELNWEENEYYEAMGLTGRTLKQQYLNAPEDPSAAALLKGAIRAYLRPYILNTDNHWHAVNTVSCMRRAERDGIATDWPWKPIAEDIVDWLRSKLRKEAPVLDVWASASLVEALIALGDYSAADTALDNYIHHPDLKAFEVSSTYRQFSQLLQLDSDPEGSKLLERLRRTVERYRVQRAAPDTDTSPAKTTKPLVIRLSDDNWKSRNIPDLVVGSRLGTIVTAQGTEASIAALLNDPLVISIEESRPAGYTECLRSLPFVGVSPQGEYRRADGTVFTEKGASALIAVIDDSIDILHQAFLSADGMSRIIGIWDQTDFSGSPPEGFQYGSFYDKNAIANMVTSKTPTPAMYRHIQNSNHGTHVASIAAGRPAGQFSGGIAQDAALLIIIPAAGESIGYSQSHIDALSFIGKFADEAERPVVVNLSQGMNAGAHDGKSALETAFDAFSGGGRTYGRVIVKSAGNEQSNGGHASIAVAPLGRYRLRWRREPDADSTDRIELWWSSGTTIAFRLSPPSTDGTEAVASDWVDTSNHECSGVFNNGGPYRMSFVKYHTDNADSLLTIELGASGRPAGTGDWQLEMETKETWGTSPLHAWIERSRGTPTRFLNHASSDVTLSIPGTAQTVIAVGAIDACQPIEVGEFSSYGPTRNGNDNDERSHKPTVCAPGVNVIAARANTEDEAITDTGTSMAAPHVTGAVALLLSRAKSKGRQVNAFYVMKLLCQTAHSGNGTWNNARGYGVLDVAALLAAFE